MEFAKLGDVDDRVMVQAAAQESEHQGDLVNAMGKPDALAIKLLLCRCVHGDLASSQLCPGLCNTSGGQSSKNRKGERGFFARGLVRPCAWNLFSNGVLGEYVQLPATGAYDVTVCAWGSVCQGVWPEMALLLDGEQVQMQTVASAEPRDYAFRLNTAAGAHTVTLAFLNDAVAGGEDRNLDLVRFDVENEQYKRRFAELFNYATTGFYWRYYEREPGQPQYAYT